jgi:hypothetical protein
MEVPAELKPDLHRTLLGPLSLATDLFGAFLPGCVLVLLVCIKKRWVAPILSYPAVGYKTKVVIALLTAYVMGKVALSVIGLVQELFKWVTRKIGGSRSSKPTQAQQKSTNQLQFVLSVLAKLLADSSWARSFFAALLGGSIFSTKFQILDHYTAHEAGAAFHLSMGSVLITCSLIPGDGSFRILELAAGLVLLISGIKASYETESLIAGSFGLSLNSYLAGLTPEQQANVFKVGMAIIAKLSQTPANATSTAAANADSSDPAVGSHSDVPVEKPAEAS